jgi:hypothetical protein
MTISGQISDFNFRNPLNAIGIKKACKDLQDTLEQTRSFPKIQINLFFEPIEKSNKQFSAVYTKNILNKIDFCGLNKEQRDAILSVFQQLNINISTTEVKDDVSITPQGGQFINGDVNKIMNVKGLKLPMLREIFPGKSDDELKKMLT